MTTVAFYRNAISYEDLATLSFFNRLCLIRIAQFLKTLLLVRPLIIPVFSVTKLLAVSYFDKSTSIKNILYWGNTMDFKERKHRLEGCKIFLGWYLCLICISLISLCLQMIISFF